MRKQLLRFPPLLLLLALPIVMACGALPGRAAASVRLNGVRFFTAPDMTRLVLDLSGPSDFNSELSPDSMHLVVHIAGAALAPDLGDLAVGDSAVQSVAMRSVTGGGVRVEITLSHATATRVFSLSPGPGHPHRVVVDVNRYITPEQKVERDSAVQKVVQSRVRVVVIDPGHGGDAPGAQGPWGLYEKDVTLAIGHRLADRLNAQPGIKAFLTRDGDYDLPLRRRFLMAEKYQADMFVSIHCNSSRDHEAHGTEVYFLSLHGATDEASKELAEAENSSDPSPQPDASDNVKNILFDLKQNDTLKKSSELAEMVLQSLAARGGLVFRGVKQAGFAVLKSPQVPSILVETAFISNRREASWLNSANFQDEMSSLLAQGVQNYLTRYPRDHRQVVRVTPPLAQKPMPAVVPRAVPAVVTPRLPPDTSSTDSAAETPGAAPPAAQPASPSAQPAPPPAASSASPGGGAGTSGSASGPPH